MRAPSWSDEERRNALAAYDVGGVQAVVGLFPGLSERCAYERIRIARRWKWDKKPWTTLEVARMRSLWRRGDSVVQIASQLHRSPSSVQQKARCEKLPSRHKIPYTAGQLRIIADAADNLVMVLSDRLGHPPASVQNKIVNALMKRSKRKRAKLLEVA